MQGHDVSRNNTDQQVASAVAPGNGFIIVKVTEGNGWPKDPDCVNPKAPATIALALANGVMAGVYHFARPENNPVAEGNWFATYAKAAGFCSGMTAWWDFEPYNPRYEGADETQWLAWNETAMRTAELALRSFGTPARIGVYLNADMARRVLAGHDADAPLVKDFLSRPVWWAAPDAKSASDVMSQVGSFGFTNILMWQYDWTDIDKNQLFQTQPDAWLKIAVPLKKEKNMKSKAELIDLGKDMIATDPRNVWVTENPAFGGLHATHASWSEHYLGEAIDVNYGHGARYAGELVPAEVHWVETVGLPMAVKRGFAVRWNMGPGDHRDHFHVDCNRYGLSGVYGHDNVPTAQVESLLKRLGEWHEAAPVTYRSVAQVKSIQFAAGVKRDGVYGPKTEQGVKELQQRLQFCGYNIADDGQWGPNTDKAYNSFCDGVLGTQTIRLWQRNAGTTIDGKISRPSQLITKVQREDSKSGAVRPRYKLTGREIDGILGGHTWDMIRDLMGISINASQRDTVRHLQRRLLRGRW